MTRVSDGSPVSAERVRSPVLLQVFYTFAPGGAQTRFVNLANHFGSRLRHVIVALDGNYSCMARLTGEANVSARALDMQGMGLAGRMRSFAAILSAVRPDWLITHNWGTIEWTLANVAIGARHIHMEDGFGPDEATRKKLRRALARRLLLRRSEVVVPSIWLRNHAARRWGIPPSRLHFIPNGIDCSRFVARARPGEENAAEREPVIGTVAALRPEKQIARLLRAFALLSRNLNARLVVVGDGPEKPHLKLLTRQLGLCGRVQFTGQVADPAALYRTFDIFALTSDTEQMPYTVLEAMASGCAIAATDVGDVKRLVAEENAPLVVGRDDGQIADAISRLVNDRSLLLRLGEANRVKAEREFDQRFMFQRFSRLYELTEPAASCCPDGQT